MRAAPRRTTSRPSSTRTPRGAQGRRQHAGNPINGGLGLTSSTDPTAALGNENPQVVVTGEHSGLANLLPGNPGQVDPPSRRCTPAARHGGTLAAGDYVYAVSDQFNTAAPGATPVAGTGESAASISDPVTTIGADQLGRPHLGRGLPCGRLHTSTARRTRHGRTGHRRHDRSLVDARHGAANTTTDFTDPRLDDQHLRRRRDPEDVHRHRTAGTPTTSSATDRDEQAGQRGHRGRERLRAEPAPGRGVRGHDRRRHQVLRLRRLQAVSQPGRRRRSPRGSYTGTRGARRRDVPGRGRHRHPALPDEHLLQRLDATRRRSTSTRPCTTRRPARRSANVTTCNPAGTPFTIAPDRRRASTRGCSST